MSYDEFFTDADKPYAENLNDSLLLIDAFDVTVPCDMPVMFNNGEFSSNVNVSRKCGVSIVTLESVDSGVTIGTDSISGTGSIVFRVYPNFNSFFKWSKIILEKTGSVDISFRLTDGTGISATVGADGTISEASALKKLQEIDVVFDLTSATISNILIEFVNNQDKSVRTGALLEAEQLINVNGNVEEDDLRAVNGDTVNAVVSELNNEMIDGLNTKENVNNKVNNLDSSTTHYPSCNAVKSVTDGKENVNNKVNTLNSSSSQYPTCNAVKSVTDAKANLNHTHSGNDIYDLFDLIYPVGSIYMTIASYNPAVWFGGNWERIEGKFLLASQGGQGVTNTGGSADAVVVSHSHSVTTNAAGEHSHDLGNIKYGLDYCAAGGRSGAGANSPYATNPIITNSTGSHSHTGSTNSVGVDGAGKNMPPYIIVNVWRRTG